MSITLTDGVNSAAIANPVYGYRSVLSMPISYAPRRGTSYSTFDASNTYDIRKCIGLSFDLDATDMDELADLLRDTDKGRGETLTLQLGTTSGFFPFGPDKGDTGNFTVRVTSFMPGGQQHSPWKYWRPTLDLVMVTPPVYSVSDTLDDGPLQIGTVSGLRYPQGGYEVGVTYSVNNLITQDSAGHSLDMGASADEYDSQFTFSGNTGKMGALVAYLVGTARGNDNVTFAAPANNYPFGRDKAANGNFTVQFLYTEIQNNRVVLEMIHDGFDQWSIPMGMRFVSI